MPSSRARLAWCVALLLVPAAGAGAADPPATTLAAEADRWLAASRKSPTDNPDLAGPLRDAVRLLERAKADLAAGRTWLAFEELARGRGLLRAFAFTDENSAAKADPKAFERLWQERGGALLAQERALRTAPWGETPHAVRAIGESAEGKIGTLVEASRAFAAVTSPGDGLFYLGQAQASAELAQLARTLFAGGGAPAGVAPAGAPRSILRELHALQAKVNAAFVPPRSIELHNEFIRLNATLKLAQELDASELYDGALYQYLDAVQQFAALAAPTAERAAPDFAAWKERLARRGDATVGELFLQRAEAVRAAPPATVKPGELRSAGLIAEQVLPAYVAILDQGANVSPREEQAASVTVTLVRWPYT